MKSFFALTAIVTVTAFVAIVPAGRAATSDDQIKSAGAIELNTELLDKMESASAAVRADELARNEIAGVKDAEPDAWAKEVESKCPHAAEHLKQAGVAADELMKGALAILACMMDDKGDLAKSDNATAKANAQFVRENKQRCDVVGSMVMTMGGGPDGAADAEKNL